MIHKEEGGLVFAELFHSCFFALEVRSDKGGGRENFRYAAPKEGGRFRFFTFSRWERHDLIIAFFNSLYFHIGPSSIDLLSFVTFFLRAICFPKFRLSAFIRFLTGDLDIISCIY